MRPLWERIATYLKGRLAPDISIFHQYVKPPYGGGNQFAIALKKQFEKMGHAVETNNISMRTRACLFNSYNFDFEKLERLRAIRPECRMVHRVDGPISVYRGEDDGTDRRIHDINAKLADVTVFQSRFSHEKHVELGIELKNPVIIMNACDPEIFHPRGRTQPDGKRKIRLISSSWSDNPNKGFALYKWLEENLDWSRYEYTFVGRAPVRFEKAKVIGAVGSERLAGILRESDIYITASRNEPCSNSLIEALSCGLPAVHLNSGSHAEVTGGGGEGFNTNEEALAAIDKVASEFESYQKRISVCDMAGTALKYLRVMGLEQ